jgi:hypothetical protein
VLEEKKHRHEVGEDASGCCNCELERLAGEMGAFETYAWNWYCQNVTAFALRTGLVGEMFKDLDLGGVVKRLFLAAQNMIFLTFERVANEKGAKDAEMKKNG